MKTSLQISVTLLMNRFHGEEWPCSPARLFRALLAGSMTGGNRQNQAKVEPALRWLEKQPAPEINVAPSTAGHPYRMSVPNNDMDIAAQKWISGQFYDASQLRTMKTVAPRSVAGNGPHITFHWQGAEPDASTVEGLRLAVNSLHTLGWGIDMAFANLRTERSENAEDVTWRPAESGPVLALPTEGSLDDLNATYARFLGSVTKAGVNADTRPSIYRLRPYSDGSVLFQHIEFEITPNQGEPQFKSYPAEQGMVVAAWLRHAVAEALREEGHPEDSINCLALGHNEQEQNADRLIYLPICSIGHGYTDGRIRRVMIALRGNERILQILESKLNGRELTADDGKAVCRLSIPREVKVTPLYLRPQREWASVTPVILHGFNSVRGSISNKKTERLLAQAFEQAGHNVADIEDWAFQPAPFWRNTPGARSARVPKHLERWPRYHVWVRFRQDVSGPVLAGIGRHYGFGMFAGFD